MTPVATVFRRNPFQVWLLAACVLAGITGIIAPDEGSVARQLSGGMQLYWYLSLLIGSAIALAGMWWRDPLTGVLIERAGLVILGPAALVYTAGILSFGLSPGVLIVAAFALSIFVRIRQINLNLGRGRMCASILGCVKHAWRRVKS